MKKHLEDLGFVAGGNVTVVAMMGGNDALLLAFCGALCYSKINKDSCVAL